MRVRRSLWIALLLVLLGAISLSAARWWYDRPARAVETLTRQGDALAAVMLARAELAKQPHHIGLGRAAIRAAVAAKDWSAGAEFAPLATSRDGPLLLQVGDGLVGQRAWSSAIQVFEQLQVLQPDTPLHLQKLAVLHFQLGQFEPAKKRCAELLQYPSHEVQARAILGGIESTLENYPAASENLRRVLELRPDGAGLAVSLDQVLLLLSQNLISLGQMEEAETHLRRLRALEPNKRVHHLLGVVRHARRDADEAAYWWLLVLREAPRDAEALAALGQLALEQGHPEEAVGWLRLAMGSASPPPRAAPYTLGQAYHRAGRADLAQPFFEQAKRLQATSEANSADEATLLHAPQSERGRIVRAQRLAQEGDFHEAERLLRELLRQYPNHPEVLAEIEKLHQQREGAIRFPARPL